LLFSGNGNVYIGFKKIYRTLPGITDGNVYIGSQKKVFPFLYMFIYLAEIYYWSFMKNI